MLDPIRRIKHVREKTDTFFTTLTPVSSHAAIKLEPKRKGEHLRQQQKKSEDKPVINSEEMSLFFLVPASDLFKTGRHTRNWM